MADCHSPRHMTASGGSDEAPKVTVVRMQSSRRRSRGWVAAVVAAAGLFGFSGTAAGAESVQPTYSEGCEHAAVGSSATAFGGAGNASAWSVEKVLEAKSFTAGEQVEFVATNGWALSYGDIASLYANGELVATGGVGGQVVLPYVIPANGTYQFTGRFELGNARLGNVAGNLMFTCRPPLDSDQDGVPDDVDECPGTVLPDLPTMQPGRHRYLANTSGAFEVDGQLSGWTLTDTRGCSAAQIIEALGLGDGHLRFGISQGELTAWIATT